MYSRSQKEVPVPFTYNGGSTVLRLKKTVQKRSMNSTVAFLLTVLLHVYNYDEAFSSTVYVM